MPKFITDMNPMEMKKLPLVVEYRRGGEKVYYSIVDEKGFYDNYLEEKIGLSVKKYAGPFPPVEHMKVLIMKHGKVMSKEEFEKGKVFPCVERDTGNEGYSEYRFRAPEKNIKVTRCTAFDPLTSEVDMTEEQEKIIKKLLED